LAAKANSPIYVWFRRNWLVLLAVLMAMWYAAVSQGNSAAYLLMFFLLSLAGVSAIHAHFAIAGLTMRAGRIEPVFAGERARVPLEVQNPTGSPRFALAVAPDGNVFKEDAHLLLGPLEARGEATAEMPFLAERRGRLRIERAVLTTIYPLGFFRSWRYMGIDATCIVYPAPAGSMPLPVGPAFSSEAAAGLGSGGDDYTGARAYVPGESQRHVDWRAVARGQPMLVKQFAGAGSRRLWLDYASLGHLPNVEARLSQLSRWIIDAENEGCSYGLRIDDFLAEPSRGKQHFHRCLTALALFEEPSPAV
jgi:uncharacterized protein (DUF58 family)